MHKQILIVLTSLFFALALCGVVCAAESIDSDSKALEPPNTHKTIKSSSNSVISGEVLRCSNGEPFSGVTVLVTADGVDVARTRTVQDGSFSVSFQSKKNPLKVTATYPGHKSVSQEVNLREKSNDVLIGNASFQLGVGNTYVYGGWVNDPNTHVTFSDGTILNGNAANAYSKIGDGIANVDIGKIVYLGDWTYNGAGNIGLTIEKNLSIVGQSQANTIINAEGNDQIFSILEGLTVSISKLTLKNGYSSYDTYGSAIYNKGSDLTVKESSFIENHAEYDGGAIYSENGDLTVIDSKFMDNIALDGHGGAIYTKKANLVINGSDFVENKAYHDSCGGAIFNGEYGVLTVKNSNFYRNYGYYGAAIYNHAISSVLNSSFTNNVAGAFGGAIYNKGSDMIANKSSFIENKAANDGGAIYNEIGNLTVIGSEFIDNVALDGYGGAFYNKGSQFTVNFNRIIGNYRTIDNSPDDIYNVYTEPESSLDARFNWWGSNDGPAKGRVVGGYVDYDPWLVMRFSFNPTKIQLGNNSTLTTDFRYDSDETLHDPALGHLLDGTLVTFTTTLGSVGSKLVQIGTINGVATAILRGDETVGSSLVSGVLDGVTQTGIVTIAAATVDEGAVDVDTDTTNPSTSETSKLETSTSEIVNPDDNKVDPAASKVVNAASTLSVVRMQKTGGHLVPLLLVVLLLIGGFFVPRKK